MFNSDFLHFPDLPAFVSDLTDWDDQCILSTNSAFTSKYFADEIEGAVLYEEKHQKDKTKIGASALVVCLNLDIDPPGIDKIPPYSRVEAWFDANDTVCYRALEVIGRNLQAQYERWQLRARFKQCLDPTFVDVKNLCMSLRSNFKHDRLLFHYNGHGVPKPSEKGELWVFNTKFTKYIPISLYDLQRWLGAPSMYVFDCHNAGLVLRLYEQFCQRRMNEAANAARQQTNVSMTADDRRRSMLTPGIVNSPGQSPNASEPMPVTMENTILLGACLENQELPQHPDLPADLFTACLTTPVRMALHWHWLRHREKFPRPFGISLLDQLPGSHSNRMSLMGEINWIFTAVTDTIAWCCFPLDLFQKLFRQDLLVAGLFRNFLLAERIMKTYQCTPISYPALPPTLRHPMWHSWDHVVDRLFHYLPRMLELMCENTSYSEPSLPIILAPQQQQANNANPHSKKSIKLLLNTQPTGQPGVRGDTTITLPQQLRVNISKGIWKLPIEMHMGNLEHTRNEQSTRPKLVKDDVAPIPPGFKQQQQMPTNPCPPPPLNGDTSAVGARPVPRHPPVAHALGDKQHSMYPTAMNKSGHHQSEIVAPKIPPMDDADNAPAYQPSSATNAPSSTATEGSTEIDSDDDSDEEEDETDDELDDSDEVTADSDGRGPQTSQSTSIHPPAQQQQTVATGLELPKPLKRSAAAAVQVKFEDRIQPDRQIQILSRKNVAFAGTTTTVPQPDLMRSSEIGGNRDYKNRPVPETQNPTVNLTRLGVAETHPDVQKRPPSQALTALRRQQHALEKLYALQSRANNPPVNLKSDITLHKSTTVRTNHHPVPSTTSHVVPPFRLPTTTTPHKQQQQAPVVNNPVVVQSTTTRDAPITSSASTIATTGNPSFYTGSVVGGTGPNSFFTSQMTAFKVWLRTADEKRPPAMQLPILLQILLSQSHRTRAMQLLSEFLDLGPWAVAHCLMVGILPYIVRLFSSTVQEVKPYLVFIWGKIIASARTEFSRNDSVRELGHKYFLNCLSDKENLSLLSRTVTAFALTKLLVRESDGGPDDFFQEVLLKQNFIPVVLSELTDHPMDLDNEPSIRMRLWLIFALSKIWCEYDEARWFGIRHNVTEVLFNYLNDICPEVRAAVVHALGTLMDNQPVDRGNQEHADQIDQQIGAQLFKLALMEASPIVRIELVATLCAFVRNFEAQLCGVARLFMEDYVSNQRVKRHSLSDSLPVSVTNRGAHSHLDSSRRNSRVRRTSNSFFASTGNIYAQAWRALMHLSNDPYPQVNHNARVIVQYLLNKSGFERTKPVDQYHQASRSPTSSPTHSQSPTTPTRRASTPPMSLFPRLIRSAALQLQSKLTQPQEVASFSGQTTTIMHTVEAVDTVSASPAQSNPTPATPGRTGCQNVQSRGQATPLAHSIQYPGRRYHQVDPLVKSMSQSRAFSTRTCGVLQVPESPHQLTPNHEHPLDAVRKTKYFAWSCRWFSRPLLKMYGGTDAVRKDLIPLVCNPLDSYLSNNSVYALLENRRSQRVPVLPDPDMVALCSISRDSEAVAYADRQRLLRNQEYDLHYGRVQWIEAMNGRSGHLTDPVRLDDSEQQQQSTGQLTVRKLVKLAREPLILRFHPYQTHMAVVDLQGVSICSTSSLNTINHIAAPSKVDLFSENVPTDNRSLQPPQDSVRIPANRVTDVRFLNWCEERSLVLCAHESGHVRIWRHYLPDLGQSPEVVSAWTGLNDLLPSDNNSARVVSHWDQHTSTLTLGGDAKVLRIWDCEREARLRDIPTRCDSSVTVLDRSPDHRLLCVGLANGSIRVFDLRIATISPTLYTSPHGENSTVFCAQTDSGYVHSLAFGPCGRLYAVGASGVLSSWKITAKPDPELLIDSTTSGNIPRLFTRRPTWPRLSMSLKASVYCADMKVDLPPVPSAQLVVTGVGGGPSPQLSVHRLQGGMLYASMDQSKDMLVPNSVAIHPIKPLIAAGFKNKSLVLYDLGAKP